MDSFNIILLAVILGLMLVVILLFNDQSNNKRVINKFKANKEHVQELKSNVADLNNQMNKNKELYAHFQDTLDRKEQQLQKAQKNTRQSIKEFLDQTMVKDIMSKKLTVINVDDSFKNVPLKMQEHHVRHLPVVDDDDRLVGLITQRMLYKIQSPRKLQNGQWAYDDESLDQIILKHVMVKEVFTLNIDDSLSKAFLKMVNYKFGCIPIIEGDFNLKGIVTRKDLLSIVADVYEKPLI